MIHATLIQNSLEADMPVFLKALALRNYRGIGDILQKMPDFKTFNFFIGANNSGKSTVLSFISKYLPPQPRSHHASTRQREIDPLERHRGQAGDSIYMALGYTADQVLHRMSIS
jgi:predicted ATP-dependent endonuclease of OLD family